MGWIGKVIGGSIGLLITGASGAVLGAIFGHGVDHGLARGMRRKRRATPPKSDAESDLFRTATFSVMGHVAKANGRVSPAEIALAEAAMTRMGLTADKRRRAIADFTRGKAADFRITQALNRLWREYRSHSGLLEMFVQLQLQIAYADGAPVPAQRRLLEDIRRALHISEPLFRQLEQFIRTRQANGGQQRGRPSGQRLNRRADAEPSLDQAYAMLGVKATDSDEQIKRAYQRLRSQHHPDKLLASGLPDDMLKLASEKFLQIRHAYQCIQRARAA